MIKGYLEYISKEIDSHSSKYDYFLLIGDFNSEPTEEAMKGFCQIHNFKNFLDKPAYYKNPNQYPMLELARPLYFPVDIFRRWCKLHPNKEAMNCKMKYTNSKFAV